MPSLALLFSIFIPHTDCELAAVFVVISAAVTEQLRILASTQGFASNGLFTALFRADKG